MNSQLIAAGLGLTHFDAPQIPKAVLKLWGKRLLDDSRSPSATALGSGEVIDNQPYPKFWTPH